MAAEKNAPPVSANRQAYHDYFIHETYECGIALTGTEVKSIRAGRVNLRDSFARVQKEKYFSGMPISARMSREIFSTMTRFGQGNCFSIKKKS